MKNLTFLLLLMTILCCSKQEKPFQKVEIQSDSSARIRVRKIPDHNLAEKESDLNANPRDFVRHLSIANGGTELFLENGEYKSQARFDTDGDIITEMMKFKTAGTYKDFDTYLLLKPANTRDDFFDEQGKIFSDWKILYGQEIYSPMQMVSYSIPQDATKENTLAVSDTSLIIINPEEKIFKNENSEEAQDYYTAMDDYGWHLAQLIEDFEKLGVKKKNYDTKYLSFKTAKETITVDPAREINGRKRQALLYKEGKQPIVINLINEDNDWDDIKNYLK